MDVERYREFIALAAELNYHRAAERAFVTQSSLSKHIAALEQHYGVRLFERDRTGVSLTSKGEALLEYALKIWGAYEESVTLFAPDAQRAERALVVGGTLDDPSMAGVVSRVVGLLSGLETPVSPRFLMCASPFLDVQTRALDAGEIDVAVLQVDESHFAELAGAERFVLRHVFDSPIKAVVGQRHALAGRSSIRCSDLQGCKLVHAVGVRFTVGWRMIERQLAKAGVNYTEKLISASSAMDFMNVDPGDAVLLIASEHTKMRPMGDGSSKTVMIDVEDMSFGYGVVYPKVRASWKTEAFANALEQAMHELLA